MNVVRLSEDTISTSPCVATIGFFDGVHRGHRFLIKQVTDAAHRRGIGSTVITFDRHPRQVVRTDYRPMLLTTIEEKMQLLASTGIDRCVVLPFNEQMASLSAHDFMKNVLFDRLNIKLLITGYDNRFGHNRAEGFNEYVGYGREMGMDVQQALPFVHDGINISSSVIRAFLKEGEVGLAATCLGYEYTLGGTVVHGEHVGTKIGYPTANLMSEDANKLIPAGGVYAVMARIGDSDKRWRAMLNIGTRPTFNGSGTTIEVHLLDFNDNIYDKPVTVSFVHRLRAERKFRNAAELVRQLKRDAEETGNILRTKE